MHKILARINYHGQDYWPLCQHLARHDHLARQICIDYAISFRATERGKATDEGGVMNHSEPNCGKAESSWAKFFHAVFRLSSETCFCFQLTRWGRDRGRGTFKLLLPQLKLKCWGIFFASMFAAQHQHTHTHIHRQMELENYWHSCCCCSSCENLHAHKTIFRCR